MTETPDRALQQEALDIEKKKYEDKTFDEWVDLCPPYEGPIRYQIVYKDVPLIVQIGLIEQENDYARVRMNVYDPNYRGKSEAGTPTLDPGVDLEWTVERK